MRDWPASVEPRFPVAVLLDRDGTLNVDTHYPHLVEDLRFLPGSVAAVAELSTLPVHIIVLSNQAGIALGMYNREAMSEFNRALRLAIELAGGRIDAFYYCPHLEPKNLGPGQKACPCSKPAPGMLLEAAEDFQFDLRYSVFVGDKPSDIAAGRAAGSHTIFLGPASKSIYPVPDAVVPNLITALPVIEGMLVRSGAALPRHSTA